MKPRVLIVLVDYNGTGYTEACLRSLEGLVYENFRVLVVDNGSRPERATVLRSAFPGIEVLRLEENRGFAGGVNAALTSTAADFYWLLNNDTEVEPGSLGALVETALSDEGVGAVGSTLHDRGRVECLAGHTLCLRSGWAQACQEPGQTLDFIVGSSFLLRARARHEVGLWDEGLFLYWEDIDYSLRLRQAGYRLAWAQDSRIQHHGSASTGRNSFFRARQQGRSAVLCLKKHSPAPLRASLGFITSYGYFSLRHGLFAQAAGLVWGFVQGWATVLLA